MHGEKGESLQNGDTVQHSVSTTPPTEMAGRERPAELAEGEGRYRGIYELNGDIQESDGKCGPTCSAH